MVRPKHNNQLRSKEKTMHESDLKTDRLNHKVSLYRDDTLPDILERLQFSLLISKITIGSLSLVMYKSILIGIALSFPMSFLLSQLFICSLQKLKIGKPYGYYQQLVRLRLCDSRVLSSPYVRRTGAWRIGRSKHNV